MSIEEKARKIYEVFKACLEEDRRVLEMNTRDVEEKIAKKWHNAQLNKHFYYEDLHSITIDVEPKSIEYILDINNYCSVKDIYLLLFGGKVNNADDLFGELIYGENASGVCGLLSEGNKAELSIGVWFDNRSKMSNVFEVLGSVPFHDRKCKIEDNEVKINTKLLPWSMVTCDEEVDKILKGRILK